MPDCQESTLKIISELSGLAISIGTFVIGLFIYNRGLGEYRISNKAKRAEFLEKLIKMFDDTPLKPAKDILEDFVYPDHLSIKGMTNEQYNKLPSVNIVKTLRDDKTADVLDPTELEIRKSFSDLLDFFAKLSYYLDNELITPKELGYFRYYIDKINYNIKKPVLQSDPQGVRESIERENHKKAGIETFIRTYFYPEDFERLFNALAKT